jgi:hypothetical protein
MNNQHKLHQQVQIKDPDNNKMRTINKQETKTITCRGSNGYCLFIVSSSFLQFSVKCLNIDTNKPSIMSQTCSKKRISNHY